MNIHIYLRIKFRAFGITYGEVRRQFRLTIDDAGFGFSSEAINVPDTAKKVYDDHGVQLKGWR